MTSEPLEACKLTAVSHRRLVSCRTTILFMSLRAKAKQSPRKSLCFCPRDPIATLQDDTRLGYGKTMLSSAEQSLIANATNGCEYCEEQSDEAISKNRPPRVLSRGAKLRTPRAIGEYSGTSVSEVIESQSQRPIHASANTDATSRCRRQQKASLV